MTQQLNIQSSRSWEWGLEGGGVLEEWEEGVFAGSVPSGQMLHWTGKTKGQGQACRRVSWDMQGGLRHCSTETMVL